jgi:hypothetical protein
MVEFVPKLTREINRVEGGLRWSDAESPLAFRQACANLAVDELRHLFFYSA